MGEFSEKLDVKCLLECLMSLKEEHMRAKVVKNHKFIRSSENQMG